MVSFADASSQVIILNKTSVNSSGVFIYASKVTEDIANQPISIKMPLTLGKQRSPTIEGRDAGVQYYDLKRFDHKFTIHGFIYPHDCDKDGIEENAKEVKDFLYKEILVSSGDILLQWRSQKDSDYHPIAVSGETRTDDYIHCYCSSVQFTDDSGTGQGSTNNYPARYGIVLNLVSGLTRWNKA